MYDTCHHVTLNQSILEEWRRHRSRFSYRWLTQMFGKKKVDRVSEVQATDVQDAVQRLASPEREHAQKDLHLVAAALVTDRIVLSCDDAARAAFSQLTVPSLTGLLWANPDRDPPSVVEWLRRGAPDEAAFRLVAPPPRR